MSFRSKATAAHLLPLACLVSLPACREKSDVAQSAAIAQQTTVAPHIPTADGRIRYAPHHRPVLVAPDGSRRAIASMLALPHRMAFGDYAWRDVSSPGAPIWIRVDLARQLLSVFRGGDEIGTAVVIYGTDGKDTPSGVFPIRGKERLHRSLAYDADMPFTLWLTADGVAIHASSIERGRATHGCIGIPATFAEKLFTVVRRGDPVIVAPASTATT